MVAEQVQHIVEEEHQIVFNNHVNDKLKTSITDRRRVASKMIILSYPYKTLRPEDEEVLQNMCSHSKSYIDVIKHNTELKNFIDQFVAPDRIMSKQKRDEIAQRYLRIPIADLSDEVILKLLKEGFMLSRQRAWDANRHIRVWIDSIKLALTKRQDSFDMNKKTFADINIIETPAPLELEMAGEYEEILNKIETEAKENVDSQYGNDSDNYPRIAPKPMSHDAKGVIGMLSRIQ